MAVTPEISAAYQPPEIPTKWEVIPVHNSDRANFVYCRRYWNWNSPARQNLSLRADIHGIVPELWYGTGIHYALEQYYNPRLRRDPVESWLTWFDVQWRGGIVTEEWLPRVYDLKPMVVGPLSANHLTHDWVPTDEQPTVGTLWKVRGLEDILPDADADAFMELRDLGVGMMTFYKEYAEQHDTQDFGEILVVEHDFSVPIWDFENNCILTMRDMREDSPNYEKMLEVHARGRMDTIYRKLSGKQGLVDHKTAASIAEDYFDKLEADEQCTTYLWAAQVEANYYGLPYKGKAFEEVCYNVLKKAYPLDEPLLIQSGMFSVDREKQAITYDKLQSWIARNLPGVSLSIKQQEFLNWLRDVGDEQFIIRKPVRRNQTQLANAGRRIYLQALDMLDPALRIYPSLRNDYRCLRCQFRAPCLALEDGGDAEILISENYATAKDR